MSDLRETLSFSPEILNAADAPFKVHVVAIASMLLAEVAVMYPVMALTDLLIMAAFTLTGWVWLAWAIWFIGLVLSIVAGMYAGAAVARYVYERKLDRDYAAAKKSVLSWYAKAKNKAVETKAKFIKNEETVVTATVH